MAITKLSDGKYAGLSRDIKPSNARYGASFYEYDTEDLYDKSPDYFLNNGWKRREYVGGGGGGPSDTANTLKGTLTTKVKNGLVHIVIMAGNDPVNFQAGDIVIVESEPGRTIIAKVKDNGVYNNISDLDVMIQGKIYVP